MDKICQFCNNTFQTPYDSKKYCSPICRRSARTYREIGKKPVKEGKKCLNCGSPIPVKERSNKLYCCKACKTKAYSKAKAQSKDSYFFEIIDSLKPLVTEDEGYTYITLKEGAETKVNKKFCKAILSLKLHLEKGYVRASYKGSPFSLHRIVFYLENEQESSRDYYLDHINQDRLDNTVENLRLVNPTQNSNNRSKSSSKKTSKYKGVYPTASGKWQPQINHNNNIITLGSYESEEEAAEVYNHWALYYHGSHASLNEITTNKPKEYIW